MWTPDVAVDAMAEAVVDDNYTSESGESGGFEASVCCRGFGLVCFLFGTALELDWGPAAWDGEEEV